MIEKLLKGINDPKKVPAYVLSKKLYHFINNVGYVRVDLDEIKSRRDVKYWGIDDYECYQISQPRDVDDDVHLNNVKNKISKRPNLRNLTHDGSRIEYQMSSIETHVSELTDITIVGPHGLMMTENKKMLIKMRHNIKSDIEHVLFESFYYNPVDTYNLFVSNIKKHDEIEIACSMLQTRAIPNTMSYYHWLLEKLPKLRGVSFYEQKTGLKCKLLIDSHISSWQKELLQICGFGDNDLIEWNKKPTKIQKLVLPKWERRELCLSDILWVKKTIENNVDYESYMGDFSENIYISRQNINRRALNNKDTLLNELDHLGFEEVSPEQMSFAEQVAMFKNAKRIIGSPGGALTNLIFAKDSIIFSLTHESLYSHCLNYHELIEVLNHGGFNLTHHPIISNDPTVDNPHSNFSIQENKVVEEIIKFNTQSES